MADPNEGTLEPGGEGAPAPTPEVTPEDGARRHLERVANRYGGTFEAPPDDGGEPTRAEPARPTTPAAAAGRSAREIAPGFHERVSRNSRIRQLEQENQALRDAFSAALNEDPAAQPGPEPDFDADPRAWYDWKLAEKLRPLMGLVEQQQVQQQQARETYQQREARSAYMRERAEIMSMAEGEYQQTPEGAGYLERLNAGRQVLFERYVDIVGDQARAAALTGAHLDGMVTQALQLRINPAVFVDRMLAASLPAAVNAPAPAPPRPRPVAPVSAADERTAEQLRAARGSGVAGSISRTTAPTEPREPKAGVHASVKDLRAALGRMGAAAGSGKNRIVAQRLEAMEAANRR